MLSFGEDNFPGIFFFINLNDGYIFSKFLIDICLCFQYNGISVFYFFNSLKHLIFIYNNIKNIFYSSINSHIKI